jgi:hypothetical protein
VIAGVALMIALKALDLLMIMRHRKRESNGHNPVVHAIEKMAEANRIAVANVADAHLQAAKEVAMASLRGIDALNVVTKEEAARTRSDLATAVGSIHGMVAAHEDREERKWDAVDSKLAARP